MMPDFPCERQASGMPPLGQVLMKSSIMAGLQRPYKAWNIWLSVTAIEGTEKACSSLQ